MHRSSRAAKPIPTSLVLATTGFAVLCPANLPAPGFEAAAAQGFGVPLVRSGRHSLRRQPARVIVALPVPRPRDLQDATDEPPSSVATSPRPAAPTTSSDVEKAPDGQGKDGKGKDGGAVVDAPGASSKEPPSQVRAIAPSGADAGFDPRQPPVDDGCPGRLAAGDVAVEPVAIGPQPDARCTVVQPVRLGSMTLADGGKVAFPDHPTIACATADTFARYVRDLLVPLAKGSYGSPVDAVWTGPGLECRARDHVRGAKLSAHGQGLAIDIAQLALADGRRIAVGDPRTPTDQGFETAARAAACGYFHTTLGPGTDSYHRNHWHFDLEQRGRTGDMKYCK